MSADSQPVELSVVVAAQRPGPALEACLGSLRGQAAATRLEVIVADGSSQESLPRLRERFAGVRLLKLPAETSVPLLWLAGIRASRGKIVALTIEQCLPEADWAEQILRAHTGEFPAIGGALDIEARAGLADWAIYFSRYNRYIRPFAAGLREDLAGDNCSYKRAALEDVREAMSEGFWETFVHRAMRARGASLLCEPSIVVRYGGGIRWNDFVMRRFVDGRYFAARRSRQMQPFARVLRAAGFPVTALLMFRRMAGRVWKTPKYRRKLLQASPLMMAFLAAWTLGECAGYLLGASGHAGIAEEKKAAVDSL